MVERIGDIDNLSVLFSAVFNSVSMMVEAKTLHAILLMRKGKKNSEQKVFKSNV